MLRWYFRTTGARKVRERRLRNLHMVELNEISTAPE